MKRLLLIGAGGHGRVVADAAEAIGYSDISFLDDAWQTGNANSDWPIIAGITNWRDADPSTTELFVSIGDNATRLTLGQEIEKDGRFDLPFIIHPRSTVSPRARIGPGAVIMAGAVVQAFAEICRFAIVNTSATVDHDCQIGDGVHVSPGANVAGTVVVGTRSWIGIGASVRQTISIGSDVVVGAGAAVVSDIPHGTRVVGIPAKPARRS